MIKAKPAIKNKVKIDISFDEQLDTVLDKTIDKVGVDNITNAKNILDNIKSKKNG